MPDHYVIAKHCGGWVISVDGAMLLICERKRAAIRAVQDATTKCGLGSNDVNGSTRPRARSRCAEPEPVSEAVS